MLFDNTVLEPSGKVPSLLVFVDIIESSKFSSVLDSEDYARKLINFQNIFTSLGRRYFPEPKDKVTEFCEVRTRGDEGTVFCIEPDKNKRADLVYRAIEFIFHLKGILYFIDEVNNTTSKSTAPLKMGIGAGIHIGEITPIINKHDSPRNISRIEGYPINYAKRIENASREGNSSNIMISKEVLKYLDGNPIVYSTINISLKGIEDRANVSEIISGLFYEMIFEKGNDLDKYLIDQCIHLSKNPILINEPWLKPLIISVLDCIQNNAITKLTKSDIEGFQRNLAWFKTHEEDPILLYIRAKEFCENGRFTNQLRYLKQILDKYPEFIFARVHMINSCWEIAQNSTERSEKIFARDLAFEYFEKFPHMLTNDEKVKFNSIIDQTS